MKKTLSTLLLTSILFSMILTSCTDTDTNSGGPAANDSSSDATVETEAETELTDGLPEDLNFDGRELRLLSVDYLPYGSHSLITADEQNGEILNDAIYNRNLAVSE